MYVVLKRVIVLILLELSYPSYCGNADKCLLVHIVLIICNVTVHQVEVNQPGKRLVDLSDTMT